MQTKTKHGLPAVQSPHGASPRRHRALLPVGAFIIITALGVLFNFSTASPPDTGQSLVLASDSIVAIDTSPPGAIAVQSWTIEKGDTNITAFKLYDSPTAGLNFDQGDYMICDTAAPPNATNAITTKKHSGIITIGSNLRGNDHAGGMLLASK